MRIPLPALLLATLLRQGVELHLGLLAPGDVQVVGGLLEHTLEKRREMGVGMWVR